MSSSKTHSCADCLINKSHKLPFANSSITSTSPLEYIFTDVWTSPITSVDNYKYYLVLVDHYTRYTWLYPLHRKSDVKTTFVAYKALVENRFQAKIRTCILTMEVNLLRFANDSSSMVFLISLVPHTHPNTMGSRNVNTAILWRLALLSSPKHLSHAHTGLTPSPLRSISSIACLLRYCLSTHHS